MQQSHYYLLFIGTRVGGYYNLKEKISITQKEYRTAYEASKKGSPKILLFVRQEIWNIRQDRKALRDYLKDNYVIRYELKDKDIINITNHNSDFVNDADFIFTFLQEIERNEDMKKAQKGERDYPQSNWVHTFSSYKDIIDTLNVEFHFSKSLSRVAITENLRIELLSNLRAMTTKLDGVMHFCNGTMMYRRHKYKGDLHSFSDFTSKDMAMISVYCILDTSVGSNLTTQFIDTSLTSGEFLQYNTSTDSFEASQIHDGLLKLKLNIERLNRLEKDFSDTRFQLHSKFKNYPMTDNVLSVKNTELIQLFAISDCQHNILLLLTSLYKAINGDERMLSKIRLHPPSPLKETADRLEQEKFTNEELIEFINQIKL